MQSPLNSQSGQKFSEMKGSNTFSQPKKKKGISLRGMFNSKSIVLIVVLQIIMIVLLLLNLFGLSPAAIIQNMQNQQVISELSSKTTVPSGETPVIATVTDANKLREENAVQAEVYKDAQNGDFVIGYGEKMYIFRRSEGRIVYEGDNPNTALTKAQEKIISEIVTAARDSGVITTANDETPQLSLITDVKALQTNDPVFYKNARANDIIALFPQAEVILIYNQESKTVVNYGNYTTQITAL